MNPNAITVQPQTPEKTVGMAIADLKYLMGIVATIRQDVLKDKVDYGVIPGTDKPTLLLPGMEKLMRALNAVPRYSLERAIVDYDKPLFHYEYRCELVDAETGVRIPGGEAIGICTSYESKYRWREAKRKCPICEQETIIKGKDEYGGGWLCWQKRGGCGAKFQDGDKSIEDQSIGRVLNEDIFDQINTICKMAQKRALGSAIKGAAGVSEFFTVDLEYQPAYRDAIEGSFEPVDPEPPTPPTPRPPQQQTPPPSPAIVERVEPDIKPADAEPLAQAVGAEGQQPWRETKRVETVLNNRPLPEHVNRTFECQRINIKLPRSGGHIIQFIGDGFAADAFTRDPLRAAGFADDKEISVEKAGPVDLEWAIVVHAVNERKPDDTRDKWRVVSAERK